MRLLTVILAALFGAMALAGDVQAGVSRVVVVETNDSVGYLQNLEKVRAINTRLGNKSVIRAWRARFAGPETGSLVVVIDFDDMSDFAASETKLRADPEFQALQKEMDKTRKIVSDSLYDELK